MVLTCYSHVVFVSHCGVSTVLSTDGALALLEPASGVPNYVRRALDRVPLRRDRSGPLSENSRLL